MSREKLIYIASPYAGDIETNTAFAKKACRYAIHQGHTPIAVHLLYPQMLDDAEPTEREIGLRLGHRSFPNKRILRNNLCFPACE